MLKYASLIGAGLLACGLSQQAQASTYLFELTLDQTYGALVFGETSDFTNVVSTPFLVTDPYNPAGGIYNSTGTGDVTITVDNVTFSGHLSIQFAAAGPGLYGANGILSGVLNSTNGESINIGSVNPGSFNLNGTGLSNTPGGNAYLTATPLPAGLPLVAGGLGLVGWFSRGRKQKAAIAA